MGSEAHRHQVSKQLHTVLDQNLQCASEFGEQLARALAVFDRELGDWRRSVANLQNSTSLAFDDHLPRTAVDSETLFSKRCLPKVSQLPMTSEHQTLRGKIKELKIMGTLTPEQPSDVQLVHTHTSAIYPVIEEPSIDKQTRPATLLPTRDKGVFGCAINPVIEEPSVDKETQPATLLPTKDKGPTTMETSKSEKLAERKVPSICVADASENEQIRSVKSEPAFKLERSDTQKSMKSIQRLHHVNSAQHEEAEVRLRELWTSKGSAHTRLVSAHCVSSGDAQQFMMGEVKSNNRQEGPKHFLDKFVIDPASHKRMLLDILSMIVVAYDIVVFPLVAFSFDETKFAEIMRVATTIYWTIDLVLSFFSGYQYEEETEMHFLKTFKKSLTTSAPFDFLIVLLDWVLYIMEASKAFASFARLTKTARLLRMVRLLRAIKFQKLMEIIEMLKSWPPATTMFSFLNVSRLIVNLMLINHFLACLWYVVGTSSNEEPTWVDTYLKDNNSMVQHYLASFHWSIAQFTPCPINIHPQNIHERIFALCMLPFGLVLYASLLGNVTAIINGMRKSQYETMKASYDLKEFLTVNQVPFRLSAQIHTFIKAHRVHSKRVLEDDVKPLKTLSLSLRQELHFAIHAPLLKRHPFFELLAEMCEDTVIHICHSPTTITTYVAGDEIFHYGGTARTFFLPLSGLWEYTPGRHLKEGSKVPIEKGGWVCEASLWIDWKYRGHLTIVKQSDLVTVDSKKFEEAAKYHASSLPLLKQYAYLFARTLFQDSKKGRVDDIWGTRYDHRMTSGAKMLDDVESLKEALETVDLNNVDCTEVCY